MRVRSGAESAVIPASALRLHWFIFKQPNLKLGVEEAEEANQSVKSRPSREDCYKMEQNPNLKQDQTQRDRGLFIEWLHLFQQRPEPSAKMNKRFVGTELHRTRSSGRRKLVLYLPGSIQGLEEMLSPPPPPLGVSGKRKRMMSCSSWTEMTRKRAPDSYTTPTSSELVVSWNASFDQLEQRKI